MEEGKGKAVILLGYLLLVLPAIGCGVRLVPVEPPGAGAPAGKGWAMVEGRGIAFSARQGTLSRCPSSWDIIPFEVVIENRTEEDLTVVPGDVTLLDDRSRQYQSVDPRALAATGRGGEANALFCPGFGMGVAYGWSAGTEASWGIGFPMWYHEWGSPHRCLDEVFLRGLDSQPIKPGAFVQGLVLFRGRLESGVSLTLELKKGIIPDNTTPLALTFRAG